MALDPELARLVRESKAAIVAHAEDDAYLPSIREQLGWLGFQKATKAELRAIIRTALERDPEA
jgi:hypothetical protein